MSMHNISVIVKKSRYYKIKNISCFNPFSSISKQLFLNPGLFVGVVSVMTIQFNREVCPDV